jgi:hypothetical protein
MSLLQQMQDYNKLHNLPCFLFCHPICNLGNKIFMVVGSKQFLVLGMPTNFGILLIPFLHISFNILVNFFVTCMLTKKISQVRASNLSFPSTSLQALHLVICKSPFDPMHNFAHCSFATHES